MNCRSVLRPLAIHPYEKFNHHNLTSILGSLSCRMSSPSPLSTLCPCHRHPVYNIGAVSRSHSAQVTTPPTKTWSVVPACSLQSPVSTPCSTLHSYSRAGDIRAQLDPFTETIQRYNSGERRDPWDLGTAPQTNCVQLNCLTLSSGPKTVTIVTKLIFLLKHKIEILKTLTENVF